MTMPMFVFFNSTEPNTGTVPFYLQFFDERRKTSDGHEGHETCDKCTAGYSGKDRSIAISDIIEDGSHTNRYKYVYHNPCPVISCISTHVDKWSFCQCCKLLPPCCLTSTICFYLESFLQLHKNCFSHCFIFQVFRHRIEVMVLIAYNFRYFLTPSSSHFRVLWVPVLFDKGSLDLCCCHLHERIRGCWFILNKWYERLTFNCLDINCNHNS